MSRGALSSLAVISIAMTLLACREATYRPPFPCSNDGRCPRPYVCGDGSCVPAVVDARGPDSSSPTPGVFDAADSQTPDRRDADTSDVSQDLRDAPVMPLDPRDGPSPNGCVARQEICFNGVDDDCDGMTDCADSADCSAGATCAPAPPSAVPLRVMVATNQPCPAGYRDPQILRTGLSVSGERCSGCKCKTESVRCAPKLFKYNSQAQCEEDTTGTGGVPFQVRSNPLAKSVTDAMDCPWLADLPDSSSAALRMEEWTLTANCPVDSTGVPTPPSVTWAQERRFCTLERYGAGCTDGHICVPMGGPTAIIMKGNANCSGEGYPRAATWYAAAVDNRTCTLCKCARVGAKCASTLIGGLDSTCNGGTESFALTPGPTGRNCALPYSPGLRVAQDPQPGTCESESSVVGDLAPSEPHTVCTAQ